jgi:hypothetical protein
LHLILVAASLDPLHWHRRRSFRRSVSTILDIPYTSSLSYTNLTMLLLPSYPCHICICQF